MLPYYNNTAVQATNGTEIHEKHTFLGIIADNLLHNKKQIVFNYY